MGAGATWTSIGTSTSDEMDMLTLGATYSVFIRAVDQAGNRSAMPAVGMATTAYSLQVDIGPAISVGCDNSSGPSCHQGKFTAIPKDHATLTMEPAPTLAGFSGPCRWVDPAAPTTGSFIYNVTGASGVCGHTTQMNPGEPFRTMLFAWLSAGAPDN